MIKPSELIKKLVSEGKSIGEISQAVLELKSEDGKALTLSASEVADLIHQAQKMEDVQKLLDEKKAAEGKVVADKKAKEDEDKKMDEKINEKLKTIGINITGGKFKAPKELNRFNQKTGKIEVFRPSQVHGEFNNMLKLFQERDFNNAKAISAQIDIENFLMDANNAGKATPTVSDVTTRGGFSIPTEVDNRIMQVLYETSQLYSRMNKDNIIFESKVYPLMYGIAVDYIADQSTGTAEKNPTFTNPAVNMYRVGGFSSISNKFIMQKGADLTDAFVAAYGSAFSLFLDLHCAVGCVTGNSDKVDGLVFDPLTSLPTPFALSALSVDKLKDIKNTLDAKVNLKDCAWIGNRKVSDKIGLLENTGGFYAFPGYVEGRPVAPFGIPVITDSQIGSALNVGGDVRTGGTDDVLILADLSKVVVGVSGETRIDTSEHFYFTDDLMAIRCIKNFGQKVMSGTSTGGIVVVAQELTN